MDGKNSLGEIDPYGDNAHVLLLRLIDENNSFHLGTFDAVCGNFAAPSGRGSLFYSLGADRVITKTCPKCHKSFPFGEARLDEHWNKWSFAPAYAYCPHCNERLDGVLFDSVDLARHLTPQNLLLAVVWFGLAAIGVVTASLSYIGPLMTAVVGLWLAKKSKVRDHCIIGWLLILLSVGLLYAINFNIA